MMQLSKSCDTDKDVTSGNFTIKALRWWHKVAGVQNLQVCFSPLVDSFLKTKLSKDKREAPPLPSVGFVSVGASDPTERIDKI